METLEVSLPPRSNNIGNSGREIRSENDGIPPRISPSENTPIVTNAISQKQLPWKQYMAAFLASLVSMATGCVGSWSSPAVPVLRSAGSSVLGGIEPLTENQVALIASLINLGALVGSIPAGPLSFHWGRRNFLLTLTVPLIVGWLFIIYNFNNVWFLYIGRFVCGISYGSLNVALPIYNNEVCKDSIRGRIGIFYDLMQCFGVLYVYGFGAIFDLYWTTVLCLLVPVVFVVTFMWMPESPTYLIRNGHREDAIKAIKWLHGANCNMDKELMRIHLALQEGQKNKGHKGATSESRWSLISSSKKFYNGLSKVTIKAVAIAFFMFVLQRTCGGTLVMYYIEPMLLLAHSSVSTGLATVINGISQLFFSLLSIAFIDNVGRRALLLFTFGVMGITMLVYTSYIAVITNGHEYISQQYGWLPTVCLCLFVGMFRFGVSPIPWFMAPELIPTEAQRWAPSGIVCITWGTSFLFSLSYLPSVTAFGQVAVYSFFTVVSFLGVIYTWLIVPETRNKSREQIQIELGARKTYYDNC